MKLFTRLEDHYGSDFEKWQVRKQLNYQSSVVSGPGWVTVGDGQSMPFFGVQQSYIQACRLQESDSPILSSRLALMQVRTAVHNCVCML